MGLSYLGDRVAPVVIGAVIALLGTLLVQAIVVPRIEARKRREERWEEDVRAMGEFLTFDLPRALSALSRELHFAAMLQAMPKEDVDPERLEQILSEYEEQLKTVG